MFVSQIDIKKGDTVLVAFRSDEADQKTLESIKAELKKAFPDNKVAVIGVGSNDKVDVLVLRELAE